MLLKAARLFRIFQQCVMQTTCDLLNEERQVNVFNFDRDDHEQHVVTQSTTKTTTNALIVDPQILEQGDSGI